MFDETEFTREYCSPSSKLKSSKFLGRRAVHNLNGTMSDFVARGLLTLEIAEVNFLG